VKQGTLARPGAAWYKGGNDGTTRDDFVVPDWHLRAHVPGLPPLEREPGHGYRRRIPGSDGADGGAGSHAARSGSRAADRLSPSEIECCGATGGGGAGAAAGRIGGGSVQGGCGAGGGHDQPESAERDGVRRVGAIPGLPAGQSYVAPRHRYRGRPASSSRPMRSGESRRCIGTAAARLIRDRRSDR
jgi:hypothetical protein